MIEISIPSFNNLRLEHIVLDYNGTIALDGDLLTDIQSVLNKLAKLVELHILTADTFGKVQCSIEAVPCTLSILDEQNQAEAKQKYVQNLGSEQTVAIGNGRNDRLMLKEAALGIAVIGPEGVAVENIIGADIVCRCILEAFDLLLNPKRLIATLRS